MKKKFQVISPIDQTVYIEREYASSEAIENALSEAHSAQKEWRKLTIKKRAEYCLKAVEYLVANADELGKEITMQMGRPIRYTPNEIKGGVKERAEYMISIAEQSLADVNLDDHRYIKRVPHGIVLVLAPWNYPYLTSVNSIIPALMSGNVVVLKHSDQTPLTAERYAEAFEHAGLPSGVFQFLHTNHDQIAQIIKDERINYVAFTGSVEGGNAIQNSLSDRFVNAGLELGGKDPAYVRSDADVDHAVENLVDGAFFNSGQSCCGIERIYVAEEVYDEFIEKFGKMTKTYILGDPMDPETQLGPLVKTRAAEYVEQQIIEAVEKGAKKLVNIKAERQLPYLFPEVLVDVTHDMDIMKKESFGPVVGIMKVGSDDEAIRLMNDSEYGLTASIWTKDIGAARDLGEQLETGTVFMNRCDYLDPQLAWTGVKNSGKGCTLSSVGYEGLTRPQSFHLREL
ncbi:aldehyde dehydrogenase family protein [Portibacter lacus]|uniref:Aldehyde dehydrogenase n=1 Tax=Portibacter lacus TaxID=1099794 RepID=A0AA37WE45_9BACT|nr:aldehyde dehydrogenase family protein [Portibacter lacus]GLR15825.1 aldehyde dehydrogenase [Portibacter lacus]